ALVIAERENCLKVVSLPATTAAAALAKFACLIELATDTFQDDKGHPAHPAIATLKDAVDYLPGAQGRAVQVALQGLLHLAEGYHAERSARVGAQAKRIRASLDEVEGPLTDAECAVDALSLLLDRLGGGEIGNATTYLTNQLRQHLKGVRARLEDSLALASEGMKGGEA
ncbi:MAG: hypothetical protein ACLGJC_05705, partial [Alphaproteobacteria bacterium]